MSGLRDWIASAKVPADVRPAFERALGTPWCWPGDRDRERHPLLRERAAPSEPAIGEVLLASVSHEAREALWRLAWRRQHASDDRPFGPMASECIERIASHTPRVVPHLHSLAPTRPDARPQFASVVYKRGDGRDTVLDDLSYGLPMLLALASRMMDRPVPARFAATGEVQRDGAVASVQGIDRKLSVIAEAALAVDCVLVPEVQRDEAERWVSAHGSSLKVVGVASTTAALKTVFPEAWSAPPEAWGDNLRGVLNELLALCQQGGNLGDWRPVVRSAEWLLARVDPNSPEGLRANFAAKIASRHANGASITIPWEERFTRKPESAAHIIQAAADAGADELPTYIDRAITMLRDDQDPDELRLAGAVGRALATMRRYTEAVIRLRSAVKSWMVLGQPNEASYPLSEWIRVSALVSAPAGWTEARDAGERYLAASHAGIGPVFVRAALGRGSITRGETEAGLEELCDVEREVPWLSRSAMRWRALGLVALGRRHEAHTLRDELAQSQEDDGAMTVEARLAALDVALEQHEDPTAALRALREMNPQGTRWLFDDALAAREVAVRVAREIPY